MTAKQKPPPNPILGPLTLYMPSSMPFDPQLWFVLVGLEFEIYGITSVVGRFKWSAGRLPPDATSLYRDAIMPSRSYEALKKAEEGKLNRPC